jgi:hypothetical protein
MRAGLELDRLLDLQNIAVSLDTMTRAARAPGKRLIIRIATQRGLRDGSVPIDKRDFVKRPQRLLGCVRWKLMVRLE